MKNKIILPWVRVLIALVGTLIVFILSKFLTSDFIPSKPEDVLIFQNALLLIVLGSSIIEYKYTNPSEALVNSLFGLIYCMTVKDDFCHVKR